MKKFENGVYIELTADEISLIGENKPIIPYKERVILRIREKYSIDDELAILRQRDTKPEEYEEYNAFVEQIKAEERK